MGRRAAQSEVRARTALAVRENRPAACFDLLHSSNATVRPAHFNVAQAMAGRNREQESARTLTTESALRIRLAHLLQRSPARLRCQRDARSGRIGCAGAIFDDQLRPRTASRRAIAHDRDVVAFRSFAPTAEQRIDAAVAVYVAGHSSPASLARFSERRILH